MRRKDFTIAERTHVVQFLLEGSKNGVIARGRREAAVTKFKSSRRTISRIWAEAKKQQEVGSAITLHSGKTHFRMGRRVQINLELISSVELHKRANIRSLANAINCSKSTVGRWIKGGLIRAHTSAIRPDLTVPNKLLRVRFSLESLELDRMMNILKFKSMYNTIHIDEKWFYMTKGVHRFYLTPNETEPYRTCKSKKFITKVMFMCAVSRPEFGPESTVLFDGKIGKFPFTYKAAARRACKNRPAGTMETKAIDSVTKEVVRDCLINKIIPAIKAKWPADRGRHVFIQQDNAKPHIKDNDLLFREASIDDGFTFTLVQQPPNSPDTNVNDLGWFNAIQSLQHETACHSIDDLVNTVEKSFQELSAIKLNNLFLSLQGCMLEILKVNGQNKYKLPHIGKESMIRAGTLPTNLEVDATLVKQSVMHLMECGETVMAESISSSLGINME